MSSLVAEVLKCTGKLEKESIELKVDALKRKLEDIKLEVQASLKSKYIDFFPQILKLDNLITDLQDIGTKYEALNNQIEKEIKPQMANSVVEFNDVLEDLKRIKVLKDVALSLALLSQYLSEAKSSLATKSYLNAVNYLLKFESVGKLLKIENHDEITVVSALRTEYIVTMEKLIYDLTLVWREKIMVTSNLELKKEVCINFEKVTCGQEDREQIIALKLLKHLRPVLKEFGKKFLGLVCETVLSNAVTVKLLNSSLTLAIMNENRPSPIEVFEVLKKMFLFLHQHLFHLSIALEEGGSEFPQTVMIEFGMAIGDDFSSLVIEKCLKVAVPKQSKDLESFHKEIEAADNFCNLLQQLGFINNTNNKLRDFIKNVDALPVNEMAQNLLSQARSLMKKALHQTDSLGTEPLSSPERIDSSRLSRLGSEAFTFPRCQISTSVKDLALLLHKIKYEAMNIGPDHAARMYYIARDVCELYICIVPTYHKEEIEKIPQQTAIYHNNCMYLAHKLGSLGIQYESEIQPQILMTFVDLIPQIRKLGTEAFLAQMRLQKQQILQLLQDQQAYGSMLMEEVAVSKAEKAVNQCLCQLQLLKKVWSEVLPSAVYFKAIGALFNTCLEEIILRITSMEDIAAEAAAHLDSTFSLLLKQGPDLFKIPSVDKSDFVHHYVHQWFKFQELQLVLSASMREIVDRWACAKGPLASHFTAEEVKHLIRALFQNTERRAAVLAKIR